MPCNCWRETETGLTKEVNLNIMAIRGLSEGLQVPLSLGGSGGTVLDSLRVANNPVVNNLLGLALRDPVCTTDPSKLRLVFVHRL